MMINARKGPLCNLWTTQALISLCIRAGWSVPSLCAYRINEYCSMSTNRECSDQTAWMPSWSGHTLSTNCIRSFFVCWASLDRGVLCKQTIYSKGENLFSFIYFLFMVDLFSEEIPKPSLTGLSLWGLFPLLSTHLFKQSDVKYCNINSLNSSMPFIRNI